MQHHLHLTRALSAVLLQSPQTLHRPQTSQKKLSKDCLQLLISLLFIVVPTLSLLFFCIINENFIDLINYETIFLNDHWSLLML
jgi:hypothetical protein